MWAHGSCLGVAGPGSRGPLAPHDGYTMGSIRARPTRRVVSAQGSFWGWTGQVWECLGPGWATGELRASADGRSMRGCPHQLRASADGQSMRGAARTILGFHPEAQKEVGAGSWERGELCVCMSVDVPEGHPQRMSEKFMSAARGRGAKVITWRTLERLGPGRSGQQGDGSREPGSRQAWRRAQPCQPTQVFRGH